MGAAFFNTIYHLILFLLLLTACHTDKSVEVIDANGLKYMESRDALVFITPRLVVAGGGAIWRTENGGHDWQSAIVRESSSIHALTRNEGNIYASVYMDEGSAIMWSSDAGASWELIRLGWDRIYPFDECISALPVGETFNLYYLSDPLQIDVVHK